MLEVTLLTPSRVVYEGEAGRVIVPGEKGIFEICPFHKPIVSRLLPGRVVVDRKIFRIKHGIVQVNRNRVGLIVQLERETQRS